MLNCFESLPWEPIGVLTDEIARRGQVFVGLFQEFKEMGCVFAWEVNNA